ncbi:hypothetical protein NFC81_05850 [Salinispirillum sp. LH 10-3-1]|uniref:Phosphate acetyltransferase n=1 Tax=Salinispirillum sp. LH 10-3-1 TaxID=2952525 RepID=A0AB38YIY8_9GAMM
MTVTDRLFNTLSVGQQAQVTRTFTAADVLSWQAIAKANGPTQQVPEPLIAGLFSYLLGVKLPGSGTMYLKQDMTFEMAAQVDTPLEAVVTIQRLRKDKSLVNLDTQCTDHLGRLVCHGHALVMYRL